jgi:hypothetical protein
MNKTLAYAIFVNDEFVSTVFFPEDGDEYTKKVTAALKSNPAVVLDEESDIPNTYRYSLYVDEEYVDKFYQRKFIEGYTRLEILNSSLQSNPRIVWIEADYDTHPGMNWNFEGDEFVRIDDI